MLHAFTLWHEQVLVQAHFTTASQRTILISPSHGVYSLFYSSYLYRISSTYKYFIAQIMQN